MKKHIIITAIALMSTQAFAADFRDASLKGSTDVSNLTINQGKSSIDQTKKIADVTAKHMKALISKNLASSTKASGAVGRAIVEVSQVSKPVFQLTAKGLAMVFDLTVQGSESSYAVTKKIVILLDPSSEASGKALSFILKKMSVGSEVSSDVTSKVLEILGKVLEKPLDLTSDGISEISKLLSKGSEASSEVANHVIGEENIENGLKLTGNGISLTSKGIGSVFYLMTKGITGITELFQLNKEEIQKAVERNDQETLAGLRELIRAEIVQAIDGGEVLNDLLSDEDLDMYIELRLQAADEAGV